jgi:dolichol-phosphate mannosyltransferase
MQTVIIIPTYNERENLEALLAKIRSAAPETDVLIVDDNSPDGTGDIANRLSNAAPSSVFVLHRPRKEGLGRAYVAGFTYALQAGYDLIIQMDADLSHDPAYIPGMIERARTCDLVLGTRYGGGIRVINWDFRRLLLSKLATLYVQMVTRMPFTDATGGYKCWRRDTLRRIDLDRTFSTGYLFQVEMTYRAYLQKLNIQEMPIVFYERDLGKSKMDWHVIWEASWGVLRLSLESLYPFKAKSRWVNAVEPEDRARAAATRM